MPEPFRGQVKNFLGMIVLIARLRASAASSGKRREAEGHRTSFSTTQYSVAIVRFVLSIQDSQGVRRQIEAA